VRVANPEPDTSFYIRASRATPPGLAERDERRSVYGSALVQFEELMGAARAASPQTLPLSLFYALSQAGRAIAAARLEGEWRLQGHGLESSNLDAEDLCQVRIKPKPTRKERPDSFSGVSRATRADPMQRSTSVGELWASLPGLEKLLPELEGRKPLHVEAQDIGNSPLEDVSKVRATVSPLESKNISAAKKALAGYRCGSDIEVFDMRHIAPINRMTAYGDGVAVWWPSGAKDIQGHFAAIWRVAPVDTYTGQRWLRPFVGGTALSDPMTWWALLHALSMLARYEPAAWARALAYDSSYLAAPLAELLRSGVELIPQLVLESLYDPDQP
jgi:hypothetical protein